MSDYEAGKSPLIVGLMGGLHEIGKIKIGRKGVMRKRPDGSDHFQPPEKLDHFIITTTARGQDDNFDLDNELMAKITPGGGKLFSIPVILLYDDISLNFQSRYACFNGKTRWCTGDGVGASRLNADNKGYSQVSCPCERSEPTYAGSDGKGRGKCKVTGCLTCMIAGAQRVGGVWKFRTTSYNSVMSITSSLMLIKRLTGGPLCGVPLHLTVSPKTTQNPLDGSQVKIYVVTIEYRGTMEQLMEKGHQVALANATNVLQIAHIEKEARLLISRALDTEIIGDDDDHAEEFHPEEFATPTPTLVAPETEISTAPAPVETAPTSRRARKIKDVSEATVLPPVQVTTPAQETQPATITPPDGLEGVNFFE